MDILILLGVSIVLSSDAASLHTVTFQHEPIIFVQSKRRVIITYARTAFESVICSVTQGAGCSYTGAGAKFATLAQS